MTYDNKVHMETLYEHFLETIYSDLNDLGETLFWYFGSFDEKNHHMHTDEMLESAFERAFETLCSFDIESLYGCDVRGIGDLFIKFRDEEEKQALEEHFKMKRELRSL